MKHDESPVLNHMPLFRLNSVGHTKTKELGGEKVSTVTKISKNEW